MAFSLNRTADTSGQGQDLAIFASKEEVEEAINYLQSQNFPIQQLLVQERGLMRSHQVIGVVTWPKALLAGFSRGLMMGVFFALLFVLWKPTWAVFAPLVIGGFAIFRAIERLIAWAIRSSAAGYPIAFSSSLTGQEHVLMTVDDYYSARRLLLDDSRFQAAVVEQDTPTSIDNGPTEFGSRANEQPRYGVRLSPQARKQLRDQQAQTSEQVSGVPTASAASSPVQSAPKTPKNPAGQEEKTETGALKPENSELDDAH